MPSPLVTPLCERDTPPCELVALAESALASYLQAEQPTGGSSRSQGRTVPLPPPTPVSLPRRPTRTVDPATANDEVPEDGTPSPSVVARPQRKEQVAFRSKFGIIDPELSPEFSLSLDDILEEVTGGRSQEWIDKEEVHLPSCFDWLLKDDKDIVEMLSYERQLIKHHSNREPWESLMSLAHQAARQDPGMFLLAAACLRNPSVVAVPFKGEGSLFVEYDLDNPAGNMRVACQRSAPRGRRLSLAWAGVSENGSCIEDTAKSSWGKYVVGHAQCVPEPGDPAKCIQVRSASVLGSAMVCQLRWFALPVRQNLAVVAADNRALAREFIRRTRQDILRQLKTAFCELVVTEHFFH